MGAENYRELLFEDGVRREDFAKSLRNTLYYVLGVVPTQTFIAFVLAVIVNQKFLKGRGFFRTSYYFPSITSSIAVSMIFIFLFQVNGVVNAILPFENIVWLDNANGLIHLVLGSFGVENAPAWMENVRFMDLTLWEWISGPSVTMTSIMILNIWTTIGTLMLIFLAGLQSISPSLEEAAAVDGATGMQRFRRITVPLMRPVIFFVVTLGLIGTWQVFDQIFVISAGGPQKTTLTPAYLMYDSLFREFAGRVGCRRRRDSVLHHHLLHVGAAAHNPRGALRWLPMSPHQELGTERVAVVGETGRSPVWRSVKRFLAYGVLIAFALAFIYPFVLSAFTVFKTLPDIAANPVRLLPSPEYGWSMEGIEGLNRGNIRIPLWAVNSVFVTVSVVLGRVLLCSLAGYALARMRFVGRSAWCSLSS